MPISHWKDHQTFIKKLRLVHAFCVYRYGQYIFFIKNGIIFLSNQPMKEMCALNSRLRDIVSIKEKYINVLQNCCPLKWLTFLWYSLDINILFQYLFMYLFKWQKTPFDFEKLKVLISSTVIYLQQKSYFYLLFYCTNFCFYMSTI